MIWVFQLSDMDVSSQVVEQPFPAQSKSTIGPIDDIPTEASVLYFSDKILVTLSQEGRLSQWVTLHIITKLKSLEQKKD